jgi:hypothetical protein
LAAWSPRPPTQKDKQQMKTDIIPILDALDLFEEVTGTKKKRGKKSTPAASPGQTVWLLRGPFEFHNLAVIGIYSSEEKAIKAQEAREEYLERKPLSDIDGPYSIEPLTLDQTLRPCKWVRIRKPKKSAK